MRLRAILENKPISVLHSAVAQRRFDEPRNKAHAVSMTCSPYPIVTLSSRHTPTLQGERRAAPSRDSVWTSDMKGAAKRAGSNCMRAWGAGGPVMGRVANQRKTIARDAG